MVSVTYFNTKRKEVTIERTINRVIKYTLPKR